MPTEDLPRLTERLYRVEGSRSQAGGGSGLGLAIARAIVEGQGGTLTAGPSHLGGLAIRLAFPRLSAVPDPSTASRGAGTPGHPELWAVAEGRLYLFYSAAAREAFLRDPRLAIDAAERGWPAALKTLAP